MYRIEKSFSIPVGHRLSKHEKKCKNIHGHNLSILVGLKSKTLDDNDMVMDFSILTDIVEGILELWDHAIILNETDEELIEFLDKKGMKNIKLPFDPTAEKLSEIVFDYIDEKLPAGVEMDYVTIFENDKAKATYTED